MEDMELIRKAVIKNRGGLKNASDSQIMIIWNSLSKETQEKYLQKISPVKSKSSTSNGISKERKVKDAVSSGTKRNVPGSS